MRSTRSRSPPDISTSRGRRGRAGVQRCPRRLAEPTPVSTPPPPRLRDYGRAAGRSGWSAAWSRRSSSSAWQRWSFHWRRDPADGRREARARPERRRPAHGSRSPGTCSAPAAPAPAAAGPRARGGPDPGSGTCSSGPRSCSGRGARACSGPGAGGACADTRGSGACSGTGGPGSRSRWRRFPCRSRCRIPADHRRAARSRWRRVPR